MKSSGHFVPSALYVPWVHRIRNEGTEKDLPEGRWCDGSLVTAKDHATILDCDVTCPGCLAAIALRREKIEIEHTMQEPLPKDERDKLIIELIEKRQATFNLQQAQVDVLSDIAVNLNNIVKEIVELKITLGDAIYNVIQERS